MEEVKVNGSGKVVSMDAKKGTSSKPEKPSMEQKKLSYEELNNACMELSKQNQQMQMYIQKLQQQMQHMDYALQTKRLDYLLKIIELSFNTDSKYSFDTEFVYQCIEEVQNSMTIPENAGNEESKNNTEEN